MGRQIDEKSVIDIVTYECGEWAGLAKEIVKQIKALPSAEPQIIRCRECVHAEDEGTFLWCPVVGTTRFETDDFCSYAERKGDG